MSRKMAFKVMMSVFWRKSCDPQRPSLIRKIPFPRIGFFRKYIEMGCRKDLIWGILWVCVNRPSCIPTCRNFPEGILLCLPFVLLRMGRFKYGLFDCSGDCGMCSLTERGFDAFFSCWIMSKLATGHNSWLLAIGIPKFTMAIVHADWFGVFFWKFLM